MNKALVTGAGGFLGRYCCLELASQGYEVIGVDIQPFLNSKDWGLTTYHHSSCDLHTLTDISKKHGELNIIIHCAGSGSVPLSFTHPYNDFHANVVTTLEVLEYCRQHINTRLIIPSSAAVYGNIKTVPISELSELNPISPYGVHKKIIEDLCKSYAMNFGINVALVRFFSLYGVGLQKQILWDACNKARDNNFSFNGLGDEKRDFLHVSDAARLMIIMAKYASSKHPIINGGTGIGTTIKDLVNKIGECWESSLRATFNGQARIGDPTHFIADIRTIQEINFNFKHSLSDEISKYVEWFRREYPK